MKSFIAFALASVALANFTKPDPNRFTVTVTAAQQQAWRDEAIAELSPADTKTYEDRIILKQQNNLAFNGAEQAVLDKIDD